jgi:hypothetical protein
VRRVIKLLDEPPAFPCHRHPIIFLSDVRARDEIT